MDDNDLTTHPTPTYAHQMTLAWWFFALLILLTLSDGLHADNNTQWLTRMREETESGAKKAGLAKHSIEWKMRWWMNCITDLKNDKRTKQCFAKPAERKENSTFFVCDIKAGILMHADTLSDYWMFATPPKGMGTRQYASYLDDKSPCDNVGPCPGCILDATASVNLCTVTLKSRELFLGSIISWSS